MSIHTSIRYTLAALFAISLLAAPSTLTITTLSSMPAFVSGGDVLLEIKGAAATQKIEVKLNGRDVSPAFHADATRGAVVGLVDGLKLGANTITAKAGSQT